MILKFHLFNRLKVFTKLWFRWKGNALLLRKISKVYLINCLIKVLLAKFVWSLDFLLQNWYHLLHISFSRLYLLLKSLLKIIMELSNLHSYFIIISTNCSFGHIVRYVNYILFCLSFWIHYLIYEIQHLFRQLHSSYGISWIVSCDEEVKLLMDYHLFWVTWHVIQSYFLARSFLCDFRKPTDDLFCL